MSVALAFSQTLETENCCNCGMTFAVPQEYRAILLREHKTFYCPAGHPQSYMGETEAEGLRKELAAERQRKANALQRANEAEASLRKKEAALERAKTEAKRVEKRIHAGVCTCCNRTFQNLARHMATKHNGETK